MHKNRKSSEKIHTMSHRFRRVGYVHCLKVTDQKDKTESWYFIGSCCEVFFSEVMAELMMMGCSYFTSLELIF